jgi:hypothetical protein
MVRFPKNLRGEFLNISGIIFYPKVYIRFGFFALLKFYGLNFKQLKLKPFKTIIKKQPLKIYTIGK